MIILELVVLFLIAAYFCTTYKIYDKPILIDLFNLYGSGTVGFNCLVKNALFSICIRSCMVYYCRGIII